MSDTRISVPADVMSVSGSAGEPETNAPQPRAGEDRRGRPAAVRRRRAAGRPSERARGDCLAPPSARRMPSSGVAGRRWVREQTEHTDQRQRERHAAKAERSAECVCGCVMDEASRPRRSRCGRRAVGSHDRMSPDRCGERQWVLLVLVDERHVGDRPSNVRRAHLRHRPRSQASPTGRPHDTANLPHPPGRRVRGPGREEVQRLEVEGERRPIG